MKRTAKFRIYAEKNITQAKKKKKATQWTQLRLITTINWKFQSQWSDYFLQILSNLTEIAKVGRLCL